MLNSIRIAILFEYPTLNGGERSMLAIMKQLTNSHFEFIAIAPPDGPLAGQLKLQNVPLFPWNQFDQEGKRIPRELLESNLISTVNEISPDLLHANSLSMGRLSGKVASSVDIPVTAHLRDIIKLKKSVIKDLNGNQNLIAVSHATKGFHVAQGLNSVITKVIYNGVDCELFKPAGRTGSLCDELGIPHSSILTLTVGQIGLRKGQDILAVAAVDACQKNPELNIVIAGERHSQKEESILFEKRITEIFKENHLEDRLHLIGYRNDIHELMNEVDMVIHPAHQEPLGRVLIEAGASGKAIIATNVGGTAEILEDRKSARLIPPADPVILSEVIQELSADKELRASLGEEARKRIQAEFSVETAAGNLSHFFNQYRH